MKYYIISGEASGDLHGSNLVKEIQQLDATTAVRCWGGDLMEATGATLVKHYRDLAFMGFTEVLQNIRTIFRNMAFCKQDILQYQPDVLILIDYPGFNLRIAAWAKEQGIKVVYYISPQIWAWKENRIHGIKKNVDQMLVILPFEKAFYKKWNYDVEYVGHPLVDVIEKFEAGQLTGPQPSFVKNIPGADPAKIIALLPGSRKQEILKKLPLMLQAARKFPDYTFIVAKAPGLSPSFYDELMAPYTNVASVINQTYALLSQSAAALVTSGTATLETALFGVPEVVCYKGNNISYQIAKKLVKIKYISLVNLIMDKEVVKELIQEECTIGNIERELRLLLEDKDKQLQLGNAFRELRQLLSAGGPASANAAKLIYTFTRATSGHE